MIVDDDRDLREALRDTLMDEGYDTVLASDGGAALAYLRQNPPPAVILLDWNMAPMNGPQFMAAREPALLTIPVVLLTADARITEKSEQGFVDSLPKPVDLDRLFEVVARYG